MDTFSVTVRLCPGQDDDLIAWLRGIQHHSPVVQVIAVKALLRRGLERRASGEEEIDLVELRTAVAEAVIQALDRERAKRETASAILELVAMPPALPRQAAAGHR